MKDKERKLRWGGNAILKWMTEDKRRRREEEHGPPRPANGRLLNTQKFDGLPPRLV